MRWLRPTCLVFLLPLLLAAGGRAHAQVGSNDDGQLDLRGLSLEKALTELALARSVELVLIPSLLEGKTTSCVTETASDLDALKCVLEGTGLAVQELPNGVFAIRRLTAPVRDQVRVGSITGEIRDAESGAGLAANIWLQGRHLGAVSQENGTFEITGIPPGTYVVVASRVGYEPSRTKVVVTAGGITSLKPRLAQRVETLEDIVVSPGRFSIMRESPVVPQQLSQQEMRTVPQVGEDVFRALTRLPGLAGSDYSSRFTVRGGGQEQVLVNLDGLELREPFHVRDIGGGALSVIDIEAVGGIDLMTGAFPIEYGNRLSGVLDISTSTAGRRQARTSFGLSFVAGRLLSEGTFASGKGEYLFIGRRGYLDLILAFVEGEGELTPTFHDALGKIKYDLGRGHFLSLNGLNSGDRLRYRDQDDPGDWADTEYWNGNLWATWQAVWSNSLSSRTIVSTGLAKQARIGAETDFSREEIEGSLDASKSVRFVGIKQDWTWALSPGVTMTAGGQIRRAWADYDSEVLRRTSLRYYGDDHASTFESFSALLCLSGFEFGGYFGQKVRLASNLVVRTGIRYDHVTWSGDAKWSPRINAAWALGRQTVLRAGWGLFHQSQGIGEMRVADGERTFFPAQRAEHRTIGLEHELPLGVVLRVDAYQKRLSQLRPHYLLRADGITFLPETSFDRFRVHPEKGEAHGLELYAKSKRESRFNWSAGYSLANAYDVVDGVRVPKSFDQRHTVYLDSRLKLIRDLRLTLSWQYHSGWAYSPQSINVVHHDDGGVEYAREFGALNSARYPAYHRLDFRVNQTFHFSRTQLSVFLEARNVYNRKNTQSYEVFLQRRGVSEFEQVSEADNWFPFIPSFGVRWDVLH